MNFDELDKAVEKLKRECPVHGWRELLRRARSHLSIRQRQKQLYQSEQALLKDIDEWFERDSWERVREG